MDGGKDRLQAGICDVYCGSMGQIVSPGLKQERLRTAATTVAVRSKSI